MQKIQSYLYSNRVILIADLAGFTTENKIVYSRTIKIYQGVDNILEFDIQNADQKRIDLTTLGEIAVNVMDASGNELSNSPYTATKTANKGIASVVIPQDDIVDLNEQSLRYSVTTSDSNGYNILLYCDSRFGAVGTIDIIGNAMPKFKDDRVYTDFAGEINFMGNVINHTPAIPCKFYEAEPTDVMNFEVVLNKFIGTVYVEATQDMTISLSSFNTDKNPTANRIATYTYTTATTGTITFPNISVIDSATGNQYNYMRVSWTYPDVWQYGGQDPTLFYGTVTKVVASF